MSLSHKNGIALTGLSAINGVTSISAYNGIAATIGGGGSGAWYYSTPEASVNSADSNINANTLFWSGITIPAGDVTQIGVYVTTVNNPGNKLRIGLWTPLGVEVVDVLTPDVFTAGWIDITISAATVAADTYSIGYIGQGNDDMDVGYNTAGGTNASSYNASQSGGNFPASLPTPDGLVNGKTCLRVWVQ